LRQDRFAPTVLLRKSEAVGAKRQPTKIRQQPAETPVATQRGEWLWHGWSVASGIGKDGDRK